MKSNLLLVQLGIILAILLPGCTKEVERDFLRVLTIDATNITAQGATLNARISNLKANDSPESGFLIYSGEPSQWTYIGALEAEPDMKTGTFTAKLEIGMRDGDEYWYTAFVYDGTTISVGNICRYKSRGSEPANIIDMYPLKGHLSDTVLLRLSGNIGGKSGLTVKFGNHTAPIVDFMNDILRVIVPGALTVKESAVSITTGNTTNVFTSKFELIVPEITDFYPTEVYPGETVTINGLNFSTDPIKNVVRFNSSIVTVLNCTPTQITVMTPNFQGLDCQISVTIGTLVAVADGLIKIKSFPDPEITDFFPTEAYPGEIITINGLWFEPSLVGNIVKFNNTNAIILSSTPTQLKVYAPALEGTDCQISVIARNKTAVANESIKILTWPEVWKKMADHPGGRIFRMGSFVIGGYGYTGLGTRVHHDYNLKFWRYDFTDDSWLEVAPFPGSTRVSPMGFAIGGKGYIGSGSTLDNQSGLLLKDFYEYNPGTNIWTKLANYPGTVQNGFFGWSQVVNDKAYITFSPQEFYSYVPSSNQWIKLSNPPAPLYSASASFVAGDIIYVIGGFNNSGIDKREVWAYNTITGTWAQKNDFPGEPRRAAVGFGIDSRYYMGLGIKLSTVNTVYKDLWRYDPQNDLWEQMPDFAGAARSTSFCMVLNNMAYIGTGYLSSNNLASDIYRFNPFAEK